jgi:hypothetical protein
MENDFIKGSDGEILYCNRCKENIKKGEMIYNNPDDIGRFVCEKCKVFIREIIIK